MRLRSSLGSRSQDTLSPVGDEPREWRALGDVLDLTPAEQEAVVQRQAETGQLFAAAVLELGFATPDEVQRAIEQQQGFSMLREGDERIDPVVVAAFDRDDVLARAARELRSSITSGKREDGQAVRSVGLVGQDVIAELPVLAANLAVACAQTGISTLLIDANLDQPYQDVLFRLRNRAGLATVLAGNDHGDLAQATAIDGLSILTAGPTVPNSSELLDRRNLANSVELFADEFGLVLVDVGCGPNAMAALKGLDAAVVVLRRNVSLARGAGDLVEQLQAEGQVVLGTVLVD